MYTLCFSHFAIDEKLTCATIYLWFDSDKPYFWTNSLQSIPMSLYDSIVLNAVENTVL